MEFLVGISKERIAMGKGGLRGGLRWMGLSRPFITIL